MSDHPSHEARARVGVREEHAKAFPCALDWEHAVLEHISPGPIFEGPEDVLSNI
jgi:hypothetical protein